MNKNYIGIKRVYSAVKGKIESRLNEFRDIWENGSEQVIFAELIFCILTPQSRAKSCWRAVEGLLDKGLLLRGAKRDISRQLSGVRFHNKKAEYIIEARKKFWGDGKLYIRDRISQFRDADEAREWLVRNIKGIGYKEASHFLRNIGWGENLAILDRHILKNLKLLGVIEEIPDTLSRKKYFEIEKNMKDFARNIKIPLSRLDLAMWYKEAGEVFK